MSGFRSPIISGSGTVTKPKLVKSGVDYIEFYCPGCNINHIIDTKIFSWNGSETSPSINQSIKVKSSEIVLCHCSLTEGKLHYYNDSKHSMAGQTIKLVSF